LNGGDLRAAERTFQMLYQVAGRAGRQDRPGRAWCRPHAEHPVMQALVSGDRDRFVAAELADRAAAGMPPYGRLASLIVSGPDPAAVDNVCAAIARRAPQQEGVSVLGPSTAPLRCCAAATAADSCSRHRAISRCNPCAELAGAHRSARFSAPAGRRRSLFLPVTKRRVACAPTR